MTRTEFWDFCEVKGYLFYKKKKALQHHPGEKDVQLLQFADALAGLSSHAKRTRLDFVNELIEAAG